MSQKQSILPTILLVEPDDSVRPVLIENLRNWGYNVIVTLNAADAIQGIRGKGKLFDLLLMNQFGRSIEEFIDIGRDIRRQADVSSTTPIVIMAEQYGVELEGKNVQMGDSEYVTYLEDGQQLRQLLSQLCPVCHS